MEKLENFDWNLSEDTEYFNAEYCKEKTYEAIAAQERDTIKNLILCAAKSGCFSTVLPDCHADTRDWLKDLGFQIDYTSQWYVRWYKA